MKTQKEKLTIKWLGLEHVPQILELETYSSENFWGKNAVLSLINSDNVIAVGIFKNEEMIAFAVLFLDYEKGAMQVLNVVVHPDFRRRKLGTKLIQKAASLNKNISIVAAVRESNKLAHKFLSGNNFQATGVSKDFFSDEWSSGTEIEDAYVFMLDRIKIKS